MLKRLIITGAGGFVGGNVLRQSTEIWEVHPLVRKEITFNKSGVYWHVLDLLDFGRLRDVFSEVKPDVVIHTAAISDIDYCESHKDAAKSVNINVTQEIVRNCHECGAKMVFCSTDTIFDGEKGNYSEEDQPCPVNFYGETKVMAEKIVARELSGAVTARLSVVIGLPVFGHGNSFMAKMIAALDKGNKVFFPDNEIRSPIDVITLSNALLELAENDFEGVIHLAGNDRISRFAISQRIVEQLGYPLELVVAKDSSSIPGRAPRPKDVSLDNKKAQAILKTPMLNLEEGIKLIL